MSHISGLVCAALDLALTPRNIKSGFSATGIAPFDRDIFNETDFIAAVEANAAAVSIEAQVEGDDQRCVVGSLPNKQHLVRYCRQLRLHHQF